MEQSPSWEASQEISRIFGTRRFTTVLTSARHLSLSWANSIQSPQTPSTSWRSILILSSHLRLGLPNGLFPSIIIIIIIIIIIFVITLMQGIYNYIPETNHISRIYNDLDVL